MSTLLTTFDVFSIGFPKIEKYASFKSESAQQLEGKLPNELIALFREEGLFTFDNGLFMFVDPLAFTSVNTIWKIDAAENPIFLRTAFGDFFYWDGSGINVVHVNSGVSNTLSGNIVRFLNFSFSESYRQKTLFGKLLKKAQSGLGLITPDEAYGFVQPLTSGGKETTNNLQKVNLVAHLDKLAAQHR
jgi:hypothetical protein